MADTRLSDLSAAGALSASDLFYVVQAPGSGGEKATGTQLLTLVGTTYLAKAGGTMTGALTLPAGAIGTPSLNFTGAGATTGIYSTGANNISFGVNGTQIAYINHEAFLIDGITFLTSSSAVMRFGGGGVADVYLQRLGNYRLGMYDVLQVSPVSLGIYGKYTDASNYERLTLTGVAGSSVNITAETLGTGADNLDIVLTPAGVGSVKIPSGTLVSNGPSLAITQTWSNISVDFYAATINITDTNSTASSMAFETRLASVPKFSVRKDGAVTAAYLFGTKVGSDWGPVLSHTLLRGAPGFNLRSGDGITWVDNATISVTGAADTGLARNAAGIVEVNSGTAGTFRDVKLRNLIQTEYSQLTEMTAPAAPATNSVRIYAEDNGAGKTRLMALFATGAAQQIAIEP